MACESTNQHDARFRDESDKERCMQLCLRPQALSVGTSVFVPAKPCTQIEDHGVLDKGKGRHACSHKGSVGSRGSPFCVAYQQHQEGEIVGFFCFPCVAVLHNSSLVIQPLEASRKRLASGHEDEQLLETNAGRQHPRNGAALDANEQKLGGLDSASPGEVSCM